MYQNKQIINQFFRYALVGGIASIVDISFFSASVNILGLHYLIANTLSLSSGLAVNYLLSSQWVFHIHSHKAANFLLFSIVGITGFILSNLLLYVLVDLKVLYHLLSSTNDRLILPLAKVVVTGITLIWNFAARRKLVISSTN